VLSLATGERRDIGRGADARYVPTGHLVFMQAGTLTAAPFDIAQLSMTGGPVSVIGDVMQAGNMVTAGLDTGAGQFAVSLSGTLAYVPGRLHPDAERTIVWVDRRGNPTPTDFPVRPYGAPFLSQDERHIVTWTQGVDRNVWLYDIERQMATRFTSDGRNSRAIWTPDGKRVTFASASTGADNLFWKSADGSDAPERLTTAPNVQAPSSWSPDGKTLAFVEYSPAPTRIWVLSLDGDRRPRAITQTRFDESYPEFSPNGHWIAYVSNESGRNEVYVKAYPSPGAKRQISNDYGTQPAWSRNGRELFYTDYVPGSSQVELTVMSVPVTFVPTFSAGIPRQLFKGRYLGQAVTRGYDVTADGQKFLMVTAKERTPVKLTQMILVENWVAELNRRVPIR
jgi:serine/threonine-protein kinase